MTRTFLFRDTQTPSRHNQATVMLTKKNLNYEIVILWDKVSHCVQSNQSIVLVITITVLVGYFSFRLFRTPSVPKIIIALPIQARLDWTGEVLSNPSIQGQDPSVIQCYCPATGQLIDTVPAATTADVDIAIEKAKSAHLKWRKTTFKQRALVLKTLLKFILDNQGIYLPYND